MEGAFIFEFQKISVDVPTSTTFKVAVKVNALAFILLFVHILLVYYFSKIQTSLSRHYSLFTFKAM